MRRPARRHPGGQGVRRELDRRRPLGETISALTIGRERRPISRVHDASRRERVVRATLPVMILHPDERDEFETDERVRILESLNRPDDPDVSIARARVAPGVTTQLHAVEGIVERYLVIEGTGAVEVAGGGPEHVGPGDVVVIAAGASQRITNTGDGALTFYCVCTPRFVQEAYRNLETEAP